MSLENRFVTSCKQMTLSWSTATPKDMIMPQLWLDALVVYRNVILDMNPNAVFVPCNNHSLNCAGVHAVGVGTVFDFLWHCRKGVFFSSSTHR